MPLRAGSQHALSSVRPRCWPCRRGTLVHLRYTALGAREALADDLSVAHDDAYITGNWFCNDSARLSCLLKNVAGTRANSASAGGLARCFRGDVEHCRLPHYSKASEHSRFPARTSQASVQMLDRNPATANNYRNWPSLAWMDA